MNSNELMEDLLKTLKESGWLDKANEFYQNHPEYFHPCINSDGFISSLNLSVSYQPDTLSKVQDIVPCIFISMGGSIRQTARELSQYKCKDLRSRVWIDGKIVTEVDTKCIEQKQSSAKL